ncbi:prepilin peptidase, partial [Patescibacteria group bacterium]|nr:prepilin peptidase [Patescibacteria group bacterium]
MAEIIIFIFGAAVGSFLNVVICRLKVTENGIYRERFSVGSRSHCPKCGCVLRWYDLIPIISFFILRGRCRMCKKSISWQYPLVEAATG